MMDDDEINYVDSDGHLHKVHGSFASLLTSLHLYKREGERAYWRGFWSGVVLASGVWVIVWLFAKAL